MTAPLQATEAKLRQAEQGERELQAALGAAQQDAMEAATSAARADKELRAQQSMSAQHQRLLRQALAHTSPSEEPSCSMWRIWYATSMLIAVSAQTHLPCSNTTE